MDLLEAYIGKSEGCALVADNKQFLSRFHRWDRQRIEAAKGSKDPCTKFLVEKTADGKCVLFKADNGAYWSAIYIWDAYCIEPAKWTPDAWCEFIPYNKDGKLALKCAQNNCFLSRIHIWDTDDIQAAKGGIDACCLFDVRYGEIIDPKFEIVHVAWDSDVDSIEYRPSAVSEDHFRNDGSYPIEQEFDLRWTDTISETTSWEHSWGFEFSASTSVGIGTASAEFSSTFSYNGKMGKESTTSREVSIGRKVTIKAAPQKKTTVKLIVKRAENVVVPFTATIQRSNADGSTTTFKENGTWKGAACHSSSVEVDEEDI